MYKIIKTIQYGIESTNIIRDNGNNQFTSFISDPNSTDYQEYLKWVEAGNTPEAAS